ncbi:MAG: ATP-dependent DNA helicase RecG [Firmicutes bacterium]|nr:ATP-dependent DNA helicase RecG [Bacillota bacterium]
MMQLQDPVTVLKGVGPKKAEALAKLNIETVGDLIRYLPREYQDRRTVTPIAQLAPGQVTTVIAKVERVIQNFYRTGRRQMLRVLVSDASGTLDVLFFNAGFLKKAFRTGEEYAFFGTVSQVRNRLAMAHPQFTPAKDRESGILPVYPLTQGITQKDLRAWQRLAMPLYEQLTECLPEKIVSENRLTDPASALRGIHFPEDRQRYLEAKYRMIFEELFILQTGILAVKAKSAAGEGIAFDPEADVQDYIDGLSFPLTGAQKRVTEEIMKDLESDHVMNRLVQGDVGSGKTAVAEIAMVKAVRSGYQAVLMAPTEILAKQHFEGIGPAFAKYGIVTGFLSGHMKAVEKRETLERLRSGEIDVLVGTHAVIQPEVEFAKLGLVITDEQHRFGVDQRIRLREKGSDPNVLVMTATPIPRTLAVIVYGDLDLSVIDEMPPGRTPVRTRCIGEELREDCYRFVEQQMAAGRQAYVVTPLIGPSDAMDVRSAEEVAEELAERFSGKNGYGKYRVGLLHGTMKQDEKDRIMEEFYRGEIDLLVSTVVIEVGINVPNATVMVLENAERFGLAQMHQLRGRVGRGKHKSYCFLIRQGDSEVASKRGEIMESSADGFYIAEEDLKLRGPGDIFGTRQHGLPPLLIADLVRHREILQKAREEAARVIEEDPGLLLAGHEELRRRVLRLFGNSLMLDL